MYVHIFQVCMSSKPQRRSWTCRINNEQTHLVTWENCRQTYSAPHKNLCSQHIMQALNFNLPHMPWVKIYPHIFLKIHNILPFSATAIKSRDFIHISFLHMLTRNQVCWWTDNLEKLPHSQKLWKFCTGKVMGKFSTTVVFHPQCTGRKFYSNVWWRFTETIQIAKHKSDQKLQQCSVASLMSLLRPLLNWRAPYTHPSPNPLGIKIGNEAVKIRIKNLVVGFPPLLRICREGLTNHLPPALFSLKWRSAHAQKFLSFDQTIHSGSPSWDDC